VSEERQLVKKLAKVMHEVKYIQKKGFNKFNNYHYATESDVAEKVREVLAENYVMMIPNMTSHSVREHTNRKGFIEYIVTVNMEFRFIDGETGESLVFNMVGEGQDAGDKGTYKAITGAQKYALMKVFMIPTGDDPEADNGVDERNNQQTNQQTQNNPSQGLKDKPMASDKTLELINKLLKDTAGTLNISEQEAYKTLKIKLKKEMEWYTQEDANKAIKILNEAMKKGA
jgi:hypothetical protein